MAMLVLEMEACLHESAMGLKILLLKVAFRIYSEFLELFQIKTNIVSGVMRGKLVTEEDNLYDKWLID